MHRALLVREGQTPSSPAALHGGQIAETASQRETAGFQTHPLWQAGWHAASVVAVAGVHCW